MRLTVADPGEFPDFKSGLEEAFVVAVIDEHGELPDGPIPSDEDVNKPISAPGAVVLLILSNGKQVVPGRGAEDIASPTVAAKAASNSNALACVQAADPSNAAIRYRA